MQRGWWPPNPSPALPPAYWGPGPGAWGYQPHAPISSDPPLSRPLTALQLVLRSGFPYAVEHFIAADLAFGLLTSGGYLEESSVPAVVACANDLVIQLTMRTKSGPSIALNEECILELGSIPGLRTLSHAEAVFSLHARGLRNPTNAAAPNFLGLAGVLAKYGLGSREVDLVRWSAQINSSLAHMGWLSRFRRELVATVAELNKQHNERDGTRVADMPEPAIFDILKELESDLPDLLCESSDVVASMLVPRGLPRPKYVDVPSKVRRGERCPCCPSSPPPHVFVDSDLRDPTEHTDLITKDGQVKDGAAMYSVNCPECKTTFFISYLDRKTVLADGTKQTTREYYDDALLRPALRVGQRVLILKEVCELCDRTVYHARGSMQSIAHVITSGDELPSDDLRRKELNDAWFLWSLLRLSGKLGDRVTMTWSGAGQPVLNDAIQSLVDKLFTEGYSDYEFNSARHREVCESTRIAWLLDGCEKLAVRVCRALGCLNFPRHKHVTCSEHSDQEPGAATLAAEAAANLAYGIGDLSSGGVGSAAHPETARVLRSQTERLARQANAMRELTADAVAAGEANVGDGVDRRAHGEKEPSDIRFSATYTHGFFTASCNCKMIMGMYMMRNSEGLTEVWDHVKGWSESAKRAGVPNAPAILIFDRADALLLHALRRESMRPNWAHWCKVVFCLDKFHAVGHESIFSRSYTNPADEVLGQAMYGISSTIPETLNQKLSRTKFHVCKYGALRACLFVLAFGDLHNTYVYKAELWAKQEREKAAASGKARACDIAFASMRAKRKCLPLLCWQPELHADSGCGECAAEVRFPVVESLAPLVISSSDGMVPKLKCTGFNAFAFVEALEIGFVRRIVGHRFQHEVMVGNGATDELEKVKRDEYLVDWEPSRDTRGKLREWPLSWEPADNLVGSANRQIEEYLSLASSANKGTVPATWRLKGKFGKPLAQSSQAREWQSGRPTAAGRKRASDAPQPIPRPQPRPSERGGRSSDGRQGDVRQ